MNRGMKSRAPNTIMNSMMGSEVMMSSQYHRKRGVLGFCFDHKADDNTQLNLKSEFVAEIRQLARLRHPCITTVMGAVMPSRKDDPMLIMEYMRYGSLFDVLQDDSIVLKPEQILDILKDVAQGLRFLHSANPPVIHGDLKSQNVLVDENLCAKVTDFGLSKS
jgi:serine/threonine protein kinase